MSICSSFPTGRVVLERLASLWLFWALVSPHVARAILDLPESFSAEKDFGTKERWNQSKFHIKCDVCKIAVQHIVDVLPEILLGEHEVYDQFDTICKNDAFFLRHKILEGSHRVVRRSKADADAVLENIQKSGHEKKEEGQGNAFWMAHAMKEVCQEAVKAEDDDLKDYIIEYKKKRMKLSADELVDSDRRIIGNMCKDIRQCKSKDDAQAEIREEL